MSASPQKRTYASLHRDVRFVPKGDIRIAAKLPRSVMNARRFIGLP
jgi:hypothetical protein